MLILASFVLSLLVLAFWPYERNPHKNYAVDVVGHSVGWLPQHLPVVSLYLMYPRFIHSEMMTHKDFSRCAASSRAIPVAKMLKQVWNKPALPLMWGKNQRGMQADNYFGAVTTVFLDTLWVMAGRVMCIFVWILMHVGVHKQTANRILEPWQLMHVTLTSNKFANFYNLRIHKDAQPEICHLAKMMKSTISRSKPKKLNEGEWHLAWIRDEDYKAVADYIRIWHHDDFSANALDFLKKMSAARSARSSYANLGKPTTVQDDLNTWAKLVEKKPVHASPCEHQCTPDSMIGDVWVYSKLHGNLTGYIVHRNLIPDHYIKD